VYWLNCRHFLLPYLQFRAHSMERVAYAGAVEMEYSGGNFRNRGHFHH
jgi:hypothetical protein